MDTKIERAVLAGAIRRPRCRSSLPFAEQGHRALVPAIRTTFRVSRAMEPASPAEEAAFWYQHYSNNERGRRGPKEPRGEAPLWRCGAELAFDDAIFDQPRALLQPPISSRWSSIPIGIVTATPAPAILAHEIEMGSRAAADRRPAITIDGGADGVIPSTAHHAKKFTGPHEHRVLAGAGHNLPQERPEEWAQAVIDARNMAKN